MDDTEARAAITRGRAAARPFIMDHFRAMTPVVANMGAAEASGFWMEYTQCLAGVLVRQLGMENAALMLANATALGAILAMRAEAVRGEPEDAPPPPGERH